MKVLQNVSFDFSSGLCSRAMLAMTASGNSFVHKLLYSLVAFVHASSSATIVSSSNWERLRLLGKDRAHSPVMSSSKLTGLEADAP